MLAVKYNSQKHVNITNIYLRINYIIIIPEIEVGICLVHAWCMYMLVAIAHVR